MGKLTEFISLRVEKELYRRLENLRKQMHTSNLINRSTIYNEALFYGEKIQMLKKELGDKEFDRIWHWLNKLDFSKVDIEKII